MLAYRSSVHDSTGFTPNRMMLGREMELPIQAVVGCPQRDRQTPVEYVNNLQQELENAHQLPRKHLRKSTVHQKRSYAHRVNHPKFKLYPGQPVWLYNPTIRKGVWQKLTCPWKGPHIVLQRINDVNYKIQTGPRSNPIIVHIDKLKRYEGRNPPAWYRPRGGQDWGFREVSYIDRVHIGWVSRVYGLWWLVSVLDRA